MNPSQSQKQTFLYIFLILVLVLMVMPFITTFNDILTRIVMSLDAYRFIQDFVIPWEVRMVGVILYPFGFKPAIVGEYLAITGGKQPFLVEIAWNCIGWQSIVLLGLTLAAGLRGNWRLTSKLEVLILGITGTFLVNIMRMAGVTALMFYWNDVAARVMHDYLAALIALIWLIFFWWFSYTFVLEEKAS